MTPSVDSTNKRKRTPSQQFAEDQLLAAIEANGNRLHIFSDDWNWRWQWFITPRQAAEAACRLADEGVVTVKRRSGALTVDMEAGR